MVATEKETKLNDLRKIICLRYSEVSVEEFQFVMPLQMMEHDIHSLPCSSTNGVIDLLP